MKKRILPLLFIFYALPFSAKVITLNILQTSDTHSRIEPIPPTSKDQYAGRGGVLRRYNIIQEMRKADRETLVLDCGDFCQGTPFFNMFKGDAEVDMINRMGYDAVAIGNHEFDFGIDNMARIFKQLHCPVLCANYDVTGTPLEGVVHKYTILKRHGLKIGIFGLGAILDGLVQVEKYQPIQYLDPAVEAQKVIDELRENKKCDIVICLSHLGIAELTPQNDEYLITHTSGLDVVLGGHSHTYMDKPVYYNNANRIPVPLMHTGKNGVNVGYLQLTVEK